MIKQLYIKEFDWVPMQMGELHYTVLGLFYRTCYSGVDKYTLTVFGLNELLGTYEVDTLEAAKKHAVVDLISRLKTEVFEEKKEQQQQLF